MYMIATSVKMMDVLPVTNYGSLINMQKIKDFFNDRVRLGVLALSTLLIYLASLWSPGLIIVLVQVMMLPVAVASGIVVGASFYKEWHMYEGAVDFFRRDLGVSVDDIINRSEEETLKEPDVGE